MCTVQAKKKITKKIKIFRFPCCSTRKNLSIHLSITNVGLILTKLGWFQHIKTSQVSISIFIFFFFFFFKSKFWVIMLKYLWRPFHWCINYYCRTDIDEAKVISILGVRTDMQNFGILTWKHIGTQKSSKLGVSCRSKCILWWRGCIFEYKANKIRDFHITWDGSSDAWDGQKT